MATNLVTLVDSSLELNEQQYDLSFKAEYDASGRLINIVYRHDFPTALRMHTASIVWVDMNGV